MPFGQWDFKEVDDNDWNETNTTEKRRRGDVFTLLFILVLLFF